MKNTYDFLIIGAGVIGSSLAYGLSNEKSLKIAMLDAYDGTYRASVGNYGLAWLQSKGYKNPHYAMMTERAVRSWKDFVQEVEDKSKIDLEFVQKGGLHFCFSQEELDERAKKIDVINSYYKNDSTKTIMLNRDETKKIYPGLGDEVVGSSFNSLDSYMSPAKLLQAQLKIAQDQGVEFFTNFSVSKVEKKNDIYEITAQNGKKLKTKQLILSAGLSNKDLALQIGINVPIKPEKGHIIVTQKVSNLDLMPSLNIRQSNDGTLLLGYSNEELGFDDGVEEKVVAKIVNKALRILPELKNINILRCWASLRIIPEDGKSIYDTIDGSVHVISTHSGITFAPIHVNELSSSILNGKMPENLKDFSLDRFKKKEN